MPSTYCAMLPGKIATKNAASRPPTRRLCCGSGDEGGAQADLDDSRGDHGEVLVEREPPGHLGLELLALGRQVEHAGADHRRTEEEACGRLQDGHAPSVGGGRHGSRVPGFIRPGGVERVLDGAHQVDLHLRLVRRRCRRLGRAEAVLGADRPGGVGHGVVDRRREVGGRGAQGVVVAVPGDQRGAEVEVQVAVADVAVGHQADAGQDRLERRADAVGPGGEVADGQRDVVLERGALDLLGLGDALAQRPQRGALGRAAGDGGVLDEPPLDRFGQGRLQRGVEVGRCRPARRGRTSRHRRSRVVRAGQVGQHQVERGPVDDLEGGQVRAGVRTARDREGSPRPPRRRPRPTPSREPGSAGRAAAPPR